MTPTERVAEQLEAVIMDAKSNGVNIFAYIQGDGVGAAYVSDAAIKLHIDIIQQVLRDIGNADDETLNTFGGISYGL